MNRRGFISALVGGVSTATAVRTWPFRVFSFPTEIIKPEPGTWAAIFRITYPGQLRTPFIQEGELGRGSGSVWEKGLDRLPRQWVRHGNLIAQMNKDQAIAWQNLARGEGEIGRCKTITLANLRNGLKILRGES